jgi:uncharacterized protein YjbJ (UPF0337 family)
LANQNRREFAMNTDQVTGRLKELARKTKKAAGKILRDDTLKQKGRLQEVAGKARSTYGDTKETWKKDQL